MIQRAERAQLIRIVAGRSFNIGHWNNGFGKRARSSANRGESPFFSAWAKKRSKIRTDFPAGSLPRDRYTRPSTHLG